MHFFVNLLHVRINMQTRSSIIDRPVFSALLQIDQRLGSKILIAWPRQCLVQVNPKEASILPSAVIVMIAGYTGIF